MSDFLRIGIIIGVIVIMISVIVKIVDYFFKNTKEVERETILMLSKFQLLLAITIVCTTIFNNIQTEIHIKEFEKYIVELKKLSQEVKELK